MFVQEISTARAFTSGAMRSLLFATGVLGLMGSFAPGHAQTLDTLDPLHGYCGGVGQCVDNGTVSPTSALANWGFTISPNSGTGNLLVDVLIPNLSGNAGLGPFSITGNLTGNAILFSTTAWTSGFLDTYLGLSASPSNPIGAWLSNTKALDPTATGYYVYTASLGNVTLNGPSNPNFFPIENISPSIPVGSLIVGFLDEGPNGIVATANSGAIFVSGTANPSCPPGSTGTFPNCSNVQAPEPASISIIGAGLVALAGAARRRWRN